MKEANPTEYWRRSLERWNRIPSEEGAKVLVRSAHQQSAVRRYGRMECVLHRQRGVWRVESVGFACGRPAPTDAVIVDFPTKALLPGFANPHTHLDLTNVGPRPYDPGDPRGFASWIGMVRRERPADPAAVRASVREGIERSLAGGVVAVGDIAGAMRTEPVEELRASPLAGVSFIEFFGTGDRQRAAIDAMRAMVNRVAVDADGVKLGVQPHALYSAGPEVFRAAGDLHRTHGVALSTHLAESIEERLLIERGDGPMRDFLASIGIAWSEPRAASPVECFASRTHGERWLVAHANQLSDDDIELLRAMDASVAFCARGHAYFGHAKTLGPHRWREAVDAGVCVALGTDSVINLPDAQARRISPLDDARMLFRAHRTGQAEHDAALARRLIDMITTGGADALGMVAKNFWLAPSAMLGLVTVEVGEMGDRDLSVAVLESDAPPEIIALSDKRALAREHFLWACEES